MISLFKSSLCDKKKKKICQSIVAFVVVLQRYAELIDSKKRKKNTNIPLYNAISVRQIDVIFTNKYLRHTTQTHFYSFDKYIPIYNYTYRVERRLNNNIVPASSTLLSSNDCTVHSSTQHSNLSPDLLKFKYMLLHDKLDSLAGNFLYNVDMCIVYNVVTQSSVISINLLTKQKKKKEKMKN